MAEPEGKPKKKMGRPSTCTQAVRDKAVWYLTAYEGLGDPFPSQAGLACELGVTKQQVNDWGRLDPNFRVLLDNIHAKQERILLAKTSVSDINPTMGKLFLTKHGYSDKVETDLKSSDGSMSPPTRIELVAKHDNSDD